jgi:hypothetical protein
VVVAAASCVRDSCQVVRQRDRCCHAVVALDDAKNRLHGVSYSSA